MKRRNGRGMGRNIARALGALALALLPWSLPGLGAAVYVIDQDGHVLSVGIAQDDFDPTLQGVQVLDRAPNGTTASQILPSTLDATLDASPTIALRSGGGVVVAFARTEGMDSELALAVRDIWGAWRPHILITADTLNDEQPRVLVDPQGTAQIVWWGNGLGGPIYLQGFNPDTGASVGPRYRPLEPPGNGKKTRSPGTFDWAGGLDDPGIPTTGSRATASAIPCGPNPAAAPDHGVVMSCGRAAAYQLTDCKVTVGVMLSSGSWTQTTADLSTVNLSLTSAREIIQSLADAYCLP